MRPSSYKIIVLLLLSCINLSSQIDTTIKKVKSSFYGRAMPASLYTGSGLLIDKMSSNVEAGVSYGVLDMGITVGQINQRADSNKYVEARVTMDASQYGRVSSEISLGFGHIFKSNTPIMLEISYTIFVQVYKKFGIGVVTGFYDFSGNNADVNKTFYGIFLRYGLMRDGNGVLNMKKQSRGHHHSGK